MSQASFNPSAFTVPKAKPMPVILLLDTSGSMNLITNPDEARRTGQYGTDNDGNRVEYVDGGTTRIQILNSAVRKMLATLAKEERNDTEFLVSIITFGADTRLMLPPSAAGDVRFAELTADGATPLGAALDIATELIEDKARIPSRAYRPLIVLVSDGEPNDDWQGRLENFVKNGRSAKCDRMALAISQEADRAMLSRFVEGTGHDVFEADKAEEITKFFKFVTMSVVTRSLSKNPNDVPNDAEVKGSPKLAQNPAQPAPQKTHEEDENGFW